MQPANLIVALFFLCALVLLARSRERLIATDRDSYRHISGGLVVLTLTAVFHLYSAGGLLVMVPFVSDPIFSRLVFWIGIITGLVTLVSGISSWLPLSHRRQQMKQRKVRGLDFIKRLEQLTAVERRVPVMLSRTLQYMVDHFDMQKGAVFVCSRRSGKSVFLSAAGPGSIAEADLRRISFHGDMTAQFHDQAVTGRPEGGVEVPEGMSDPDLTLPVVIDGRPAVLFLLWHDRVTLLDDADRLNLKIAADIISRQIQLCRTHLRESFRDSRRDWRSTLGSVVDTRKPMKENVSRIGRWLTEMLPMDMMSLTVLYDGKTMDRFSVGEDGSVLNLKRVDMLSHEAFLKQVTDRHEPLVLNDLSAKTSVPIDNMIMSSGMRSLVALRLGNGFKPQGVMLIASRQANSFGSREVALLDTAAPLLGSLVTREVSRHQAAIAERRVDLTNRFLAECSRAGELQDIFRSATTMLSRELRTSFVRVSTYEYDGAFLKSRAMAQVRPIEGLTPEDGHMILSLMPYHSLVRETGRLMMINQEQTGKKITEAEARQVCCPGLQSALLVPVTVGQETLAVISLGEMRRWSRYQYEPADILFVNSVAAGLALAIQLALGRRRQNRPTRKQEKDRSLAPGNATLKGQVKSSLSSILGSIEMIKAHTGETDGGLDRYLSIIDRSAQRINGYFTEEVSS
ncbi:MAG: GAF domain-containing protein [bacterium]